MSGGGGRTQKPEDERKKRGKEYDERDEEIEYEVEMGCGTRL